MAFDPKIMRKDYAYISKDNRTTTFDEVVVPFNKEEVIEQARRCLNCPKPTCVEGCPISLPIPQMISLILENKEDNAFDLINNVSPLNSICSIVCNHASQCEGHCIRAKRNEAVNIGAIHRYVSHLNKPIKVNRNTLKNKNVAVIGAGPSGLSAAYELYKLGYNVEVYEKEDDIGGIPYYEIPSFRLTENDLDIVKKFFKSLDIKYHLNTEVNIDELKDKYDAVYVAIGTQNGRNMKINGNNLKGIFTGEEFLKDIKFFNNLDKYKDYNKVIVVGAGNVAMDVSRTLVRLAKDTTIVYRRSFEEAPCQARELKEAEEEGVKLSFLTNPVEFIGKDKLEHIKLIKMELGELDESGRRSPVEIKGSEYLIDTDAVFLALGSSLENKYFKDIILDRGLVKVDEKYNTNILNVFAGGDAVTGPKTVVHAIKAGKDASYYIDQYLSK